MLIKLAVPINPPLGLARADGNVSLDGRPVQAGFEALGALESFT
jgi:hypothetical protein